MPKKRIELSLDSEIIKQLRIDAIKKYGTMRSTSKLIEDQVRKPDIEAIKTEREKYIAEQIEALKDQTRFCGSDPYYFCNTCEADFQTIPGEANFCPTCGGKDLRFLRQHEATVGQKILDGIIDAQEKAKKHRKRKRDQD